MNALFFWIFSIGMIVCALAVILNRNAVASALCFTFAIVFMSGLFVMLSAFFLAAVQIIVTAGAVMVLFLFIIMLLDLTAMEHMPRQKIWMGFTFLLAIGFLVIVGKTLALTPAGFVTENSLATPTLTKIVQRHPGHPPSPPRCRPARATGINSTTRTGSASCSSAPIRARAKPPTSRRLKSPAC